MKYTLRLCGVAVMSAVSTDTLPFQAIMEVLGTVKLLPSLFLWDGVHRASNVIFRPSLVISAWHISHTDNNS